MPHISPPRAWAEVSLSALKHNLSVIKEATRGAQMMPVVKAGAYGHGLEPVAQCLDREGIVFFGVANVGEARRISQCGCRTTPYILGPAFPEEREEIVLNNWRCFMSTLEEGDHYNSLATLYGKTLPIHVSVDVGMGRGGLLIDQVPALLERLSAWDHLYIEGIGAHLPSADENRETTERSIAMFTHVVETLENRIPVPYRHLCSSAGLLGYKVPCANLVRPGICMYGYPPIDSPWNDHLKPALTLKSRLTVVRMLPEASGVSYGQEFITNQPTRVATVGLGYADGYMRCLYKAGARVYYKGQFCPVIGRITMDQFMIDVSQVQNVTPGDPVEIVGDHVTVPELAQKAGTITWEILTSIGPRIPRIYID